MQDQIKNIALINIIYIIFIYTYIVYYITSYNWWIL